MGMRPRQMKEAVGLVLQRFLAEDSGSTASLSWLRGIRERCAMASTRCLEQRRMTRGRAEWASARRLLREEETTGFSFGPAARGEDARGGGCMHCTWRLGGRWHTLERQLARSGRSAGGRHRRAVQTQRWRSASAPGGKAVGAVEMQRGWSASACGQNSAQVRARKTNDRAPPETDKWVPTFFYLLRFSNGHILIFKLVTFLMSKFHEMFHRDSWKYKEQLSFLAQLEIPKGLQVIIFGINLNLNFP
jgi:hypothetical protein